MISSTKIRKNMQSAAFCSKKTGIKLPFYTFFGGMAAWDAGTLFSL